MKIDRPNRKIIMPYRDDVMALFPDVLHFVWEGEHIIAIDHGTEETILLRNLGVSIPAPIREHYDWPGQLKPFKTQIKTCALMTTHPRCYVLNRMGTGKTAAALWSFDWLKKQGEADKLLVIAPLSTIDIVWANEVRKVVPHLSVVTLYGSAQRRHKMLDLDADIYIVNHDGVEVVLQKLLRRSNINCIVIDEAAVYRNRRTERSKMVHTLIRDRRWVWAMTGSPTPNEPPDAFGLVNLMTPETGPRSWRQARIETMVQFSQFVWKPRADAQETVASWLRPSVCFDLSQVMELPDLIEREIDVELGPLQTKVYGELARKASADLKAGRVTAQNGGILYTKLVQAAAGWLYDDDHNVHVFDPWQRMQTLVDIITSSHRKVIAFVPFIHMMEGVSEYLTKAKIKHFTVSGDTPLKERNKIFTDFQYGSGHDALLAHPVCMSHGLTLTAADTIVWCAPISSLEVFEQANARITRVGQVHKQQVLMLCGSAIERKTYARLRAKRAVQEGILELLAEAVT